MNNFVEKKDYTINGECPENCGRCCTDFLPISDYEVNVIKKYIKKKSLHPINGDESDKCPFLQDTGRCSIYSIRPEICRKFACNRSGVAGFNHSDKHIKDWRKTFFPEECSAKRLIDFNEEKLDAIYQAKKKLAGL